MYPVFPLFGLIWFALVLYSMWLLIFPILLYARMGDILQELRKLNAKKSERTV